MPTQKKDSHKGNAATAKNAAGSSPSHRDASQNMTGRDQHADSSTRGAQGTGERTAKTGQDASKGNTAPSRDRHDDSHPRTHR